MWSPPMWDPGPPRRAPGDAESAAHEPRAPHPASRNTRRPRVRLPRLEPHPTHPPPLGDLAAACKALYLDLLTSNGA